MRDVEALQRAELRRAIGHTPLRRLDALSSTVGAECFVKEEFKNPTGSHYDRIMLELLLGREERGEIRPGLTRLLDVTSGNSGASLAWLARALGYEATLIIPEDMPTSRIIHIQSFGARVEFSPAGEYVVGAIAKLRELLREERYVSHHLVNHAADLVDVPLAMERLANEIVSGLVRSNIHIDYYICALGNGATLGVLPTLRSRSVGRVVGFEPYANPWVFVSRFGESEFKSRFGEQPAFTSSHGLLGTGPGQTTFGWPLMQEWVSLVDDIELVQPEDWQREQVWLADTEGLHGGRTTGAGCAVARRIAANHPGCRILFVAFDPSWKYL